MSDKIDTSPAAIAAILEGVTRGPWRKDGVSVGRLPADESYVAVCVSSGTRSRLEAESNAAFITAARDLVPALAAERDRLAALSEEWRVECLKQNEALSAALERAEQAEAQLAEARAEGWHRGIEDAATIVKHTPEWRFINVWQRRDIETNIRALPLPADLGGRNE